MKNEFKIKKCNKCGAIVEVINDCTCDNCGIKCCGEEMSTINSNTSDGAVEKHTPTYEIIGAYVVVTVPHVMEEEHYIEWISLDSTSVNGKKYLKPNESAKAVFPYIKGSRIYSYCNKHGLWSVEIN